jgi:hypothetical protein
MYSYLFLMSHVYDTMEADQQFKDYIIPMLLNKTYQRCGKELRRELSTVKKYASILNVLRNKCSSGAMTLDWIETHLHSFTSLYERKTDDRTTLRRYVRELTALRAGAELLNQPHVVQTLGALASELQRKVMGQEMTQEQDEREQRSYKSFEQLRLNARKLESSKDPMKWLLYELMVPADGSYALRLDARTLMCWHAHDPNPPQGNCITPYGEMIFKHYKTSKYKPGSGNWVSVGSTMNAKKALRTVWPQSSELAPLFTPGEGKQYDQPSFSKYVQSAWILDDTPPPTAQNIRSAIITHFLNGKNNLRPSLLDTQAFARKSMTSPAMMELAYHKLIKAHCM